MKNIFLDTVVIGSGLSGLSFVNEFLKTKKKISLITPLKKIELNSKVNKKFIKNLPPQIYKKKSIIS